MPEYGVREDGTFAPKPTQAIIDSLKERTRSNLRSDVELTQGDPMKQIIDTLALEFEEQWMHLQETYYTGFYQDCYGHALNKKLEERGFHRKPLRGATGVVVFERKNKATQKVKIPARTVVTTTPTDDLPAIPFQTTEVATIVPSEKKTGKVPIRARHPWETDVDKKYLGVETNRNSNTITNFKNPVSGVDSVRNPDATGDTSKGYVRGRDKESDAAFKLRYRNSFGGTGEATVPAIRDTLLNYSSEIKDVNVDEVRDEANDRYGFNAVVLAPNVGDDQIAQILYEVRGAGTRSFGNKKGEAQKKDGTKKVEHFDRATKVQIEVEIEVTNKKATFSQTSKEEIKQYIVEYVGGTDKNGTRWIGLQIGDTVIQDKILGVVLTTEGVVEAKVRIGRKGESLSTDNVDIGESESAITSPDNISFVGSS